MKPAPKVIVVEDDTDLCESVVEYLNLSGIEASGVGSGLEFHRAMAESAFDIAVLDLGLPDQSGYELAEHLRTHSAMGIIIMTARGDTEDRLQGYASGADLYLVKPIDCRELAAAIRNMMQRMKHNNSEVMDTTKGGAWTLDKNAWLLTTPKQATIILTAKEFHFIACLANGAEQRVSRQEILEKLGYTDDEYTNRALDSLVRRLRRKIEEKNSRSAPLKTIHAIGFCFTEPLIL